MAVMAFVVPLMAKSPVPETSACEEFATLAA